MIFSNYSIEDYDQTSTYLYAIEGTILVIFNAFAVLRFLRSSYHRANRDSLLIVGQDNPTKEEHVVSSEWLLFIHLCSETLLHVLSGCLIFDTLFDFPAVTKWECLGTPALLFVIITPTAGLFAFITSLDRFYCVMFPLKYLRQRVPYALTVMFSAYFIALIPIGKAIIDSYPYRFVKDEPATCSLNNAVTASNFVLLRIIRVVSTLSCVLIYIPIFARMYKNIRIHHEMTNQGARYQKKLLRMTLTISLITSNPILFFTIPDIIMILNPNFKSNIFFILNLNKGIINIIIFMATQRTLRQVLCGKSDNSELMVSMRAGSRTKTVTASNKTDIVH
ncbi:hypothetical protein COOONC_19936 [Cooperia oncophora]